MSWYEEYANARRQMVDRFLANPDLYLRPRSYLDHLDRWTAPSVKLEFRNGTALPLTGRQRRGWYIHAEAGRRRSREVFSAGPPFQLPGIQQIRQETSFKLFTIFSAADVILGPDRAVLSNVDLNLGRQISGSDIKIRRVLC